jgi:ribose transport system substrate-binding protein
MIHRTLRTVAAAAAVSATVVVLAGCTTPAPAGTDAPALDLTIAAVFPNTADPFWQSISCGAADRAEELGVDLQQFNSTNTDANTIASNFQTASLVGADAMIVNPFNNNQFVAQYTELMADGVPIVTSNGTDPQAEFLSISSDAETAGFADQVADLIPEGAGSMVYMGGAPGIPPLENRTLPFFEAVQDLRPDLAVLPNDYSGFDINKATTNVSSLIIANPDLKLIIAATGPDGVGAAAAIEQAGKVGEITLIAFDAVPPEVAALRAGTITALIAQDPYSIGTSSVQAVVDYLTENPDGGPVEPSGADVIPSFLLTADNIDAPESEQYIYKTEC